MPRSLATIALTLLLAGCEMESAPESVAPLYDTAPVEARNIEVSVEAAGVVEPETTVEVKSKASGEILAVHAETGDVVAAGTLLVEVDKRTPRNRLAEAEAALIAARARRQIAESQMERAETLFESGTLTETDYEQSQLEYANAQAQVVSSEVAVENARIAMDDTDVRAPIDGTIIEKQVEPGMVISSPTQAVSDGTILMKMADLNAVRVRTLVDETDIGKIRAGMPSQVVVAAYPNQPFSGSVLKIEPQAIVEQNVTMFAVLIRLENQGGLLKPGMNADVEIEVASAESVTAVPTAALRADSDINSTAMMLGLPPRELLAALRGAEDAGADGRPATLSMGGRELELPAGVDPERISALIAKRRAGESLTEQERAILRPLMQQMFPQGRPPGGPGPGFQGAPPAGLGGPQVLAEGGGRAPAPSVLNYQFGGEYWVVAMRNGKPVPVAVETGLTDLEYSEVVAGLDESDTVLLLPSSSLFEQQTRLREMISSRFSSTPFQQSGNRGFRPF